MSQVGGLLNMIDLTLPWCTYRSTHLSGMLYEGKGKTDKVSAGLYKGSGTRFNLSLTYPGFEWDTWSTVILETFATEQQAYDAEALLVPITSLNNPYRLNMTAGGSKGKYQGHGALYKRNNSAKKLVARKAKAEIVKQKKQEKVAELKALKLKLKATTKDKK